MKKIFAALVTVGAGIGGFLWWKRSQVNAANEVSADPWPAAVAAPKAPSLESPVDVSELTAGPADKEKAPKKSAAKKTSPKKVPSELD